MLVGLERHQRRNCSGYEQRLPWCWTEEAEPWISQQLGLLVFHIACMVLGIALCWYWQCLLMVGGKLLPHIVTPLDITTVAWCCRQAHDFLHSAEFPPATHMGDSAQEVSSLHDIVPEVVAVFFNADMCLQLSLTTCFGCLTGVKATRVRWYCASCWITSVPCRSV